MSKSASKYEQRGKTPLKKQHSTNANSKSKRNDAKSKGLDAVDDLLSGPMTKRNSHSQPPKRSPEPLAARNSSSARSESNKSLHRSGASSAVPTAPSSPSSSSGPAATLIASRFERSLLRAQKGEPGPILLSDLHLEPIGIAQAKKSGRVEVYKKILEANPNAQPGRPIVNILGSTDDDLNFQLLSLYELVLAAQEVGRESLQVSLVRLTATEANHLLFNADVHATDIPEAKSLEPLEPHQIAAVNGFMELDISSIIRTENLRQDIDLDSPDFHNLVESIRSIGLQNPPVIEVRDSLAGLSGLSDIEHGDLQSLTAPYFLCVSGHRRLLALEAMGQSTVTCALKLFKSDQHRALAGLAENINREDLHFLDKADGYGSLVKHGMTPTEISALLDSDIRTVNKYLRASEWDASIKRRIRDLGAKATTRFMLNMLAASERTTADLNRLIDSFVSDREAPKKDGASGSVKSRLEDFFALTSATKDQRALVERALKYLGLLR